MTHKELVKGVDDILSALLVKLTDSTYPLLDYKIGIQGLKELISLRDYLVESLKSESTK